jgi:uncharacterized protein YndB with AHSA1/START domain
MSEAASERGEDNGNILESWILDGQDCDGSEGEYAETVVTIEFHDLGSATRLVLTHDFLPSEKSKEAHSMGWKGCLEHLEAYLETEIANKKRDHALGWN